MKTKITIAALIFSIIVGIGAYVVYADGSLDLTGDPLISLSYLNEVFWPKIEEAIADAVGGALHEKNDRIDDATADDTTDATENGDNAEDTVATSYEYEVLHLIKDDILLAETPCELILRSGSAETYLSGNESGISDLTAGIDLAEGDALEKNHLLLVPRGGDGRGFKVTSNEIYIMVRGGYTIVAEQ